MATYRDVYLDAQSGKLYDSFASQSELNLWPFTQGDTGLWWRVHNLAPVSGANLFPSQPFTYVDPGASTLQMALGNLNQPSTGETGSVIDPNTRATSGTITNEARYYIEDYNSGDDFVNVGGTNATGNIFTASGTTPTTWTNSSSLVQIADAIDYNATASVFQAAIRTKLTTNYSAATVTETNGGPWTIDRVTAGDIDPLEGLGTSLTPDSFVKIETLRDGTAAYSMRQRVRFIQRPAAYVDVSDNFATASATITEKRAGAPAVANAIWRIAISSTTYGGVYEIASTKLGVAQNVVRATAPIPFGASADEIETIINAGFGTDNEVTVTVIDDFTIDITFTGANVTLKDIDVVTIVDTELLGIQGWLAHWNLNTSGASDLLGNEESVTTDFEIQITDGDGETVTPYQNTATILRAELISPTTSGATEFPGYVTAAMFALITQRSALTITAAATSEVTIPKFNKFMTVDATVGTGAYTHNIDLASVALDRVAGDKCEVILRVDAGFTGAGLINIRNDTGSTVLWSEAGVSAAFTRNLFFTWTGSAWTSDQ